MSYDEVLDQINRLLVNQSGGDAWDQIPLLERSGTRNHVESLSQMLCNQEESVRRGWADFTSPLLLISPGRASTDTAESLTFPELKLQLPAANGTIATYNLRAVMCIRTNHYVSLNRVGNLEQSDAQWVFMDSMATQIRLQGEDVCLPELTNVTAEIEDLWSVAPQDRIAILEAGGLPEEREYWGRILRDG